MNFKMQLLKYERNQNKYMTEIMLLANGIFRKGQNRIKHFFGMNQPERKNYFMKWTRF